MEKTSLTAADVELWLNDNVDWLRDYLQRHHSILDDTQSRHTVPAQSRCDSTPSPWHSRSHTTAVDEASVTSAISHMTSSTHQQQQVRHDVTVAELTSPPRANLLIVTSDAVERTASDSSALPTQRYTPSHLYNTSSQVYTSLSHLHTSSHLVTPVHLVTGAHPITGVHVIVTRADRLQETSAPTLCQVEDASYRRSVLQRSDE